MKANDGQRVRETCEIQMLKSGKVVEEWYEAEDDEASVSIVNGKDKNKNEVSLWIDFYVITFTAALNKFFILVHHNCW